MDEYILIPEPDEQKDTVRRKKTIKYIVLVQQHYTTIILWYSIQFHGSTLHFILRYRQNTKEVATYNIPLLSVLFMD